MYYWIYKFKVSHLPPHHLPRLLKYRFRKLRCPRPVIEVFPVEQQFQKPVAKLFKEAPIQMVRVLSPGKPLPDRIRTAVVGS